MSSSAKPPSRFILQAIDPDLGAPVLEALLHIDALDDLRALLGPDAQSDPDLHRLYYPNDDEIQAIIKRFAVAFDPGFRKTRLHNLEIRGERPYLFHSGYELPMLLDGTKQFGFVDHLYPPYRHNDEDWYDQYVASGHLHKEEFLQPFDRFHHKKDGTILEGFRHVCYTRKGQEWRIPAEKLLWSAAEKCAWNEGFERLSSMLFGYEQWQTDWWISYHHERMGGWGGTPIYCAVSGAQLTSIETVGFRAFPPIEGPPLLFTRSDQRPSDAAALQLMGPDSVAVLRAYIRGRFVVDIKKSQPGPSYVISAERLPELNRNIVGTIEVIASREARTQARHQLQQQFASSPRSSQ